MLLPLELDLLDALLTSPDAHGFALGQALVAQGERSVLGHGTLYKALGRLEDGGLVTSAWEQGDPAALGRPLRRLYRVTIEGRAALAAQRVRTTAPARRRGLATP